MLTCRHGVQYMTLMVAPGSGCHGLHHASWVQKVSCAGPEAAEKLMYLSPATLLVVPNTLVPVRCPLLQAHGVDMRSTCLCRTSTSLL